MAQREKPPGMVAWYDPAQLGKTGLQTILTSIFARRADARVLMALGGPQERIDLSERDALWIDFVADTGDGWRPTTAVLRSAAKPSLTDEGETLPRGELLLLGGDQVYPTGSLSEYERRLIKPMTKVSEEKPANPPLLVAIPGNHDWYDGLVGFTSVFLQRARLGMWRTEQTRSYQCIKLPHGHWLLAVDLQLQQDLDVPQRLWFEEKLSALQQGDRVILCLAEPLWVFRQQYAIPYNRELKRLLGFIEERGASIPLWLAGDLHHYRRLRCTAGIDQGAELVTAGGGGAFLHPTHTPSKERLRDNYRRSKTTYDIACEYPRRSLSRRISSRNLLFPFYNPWFGVAGGVIYTVLASMLPHPTCVAQGPLPAHGFFVQQGDSPSLRETLVQAATAPGAVALVAALLAAVVYFTDSHNRWYKTIAGGLHGALHLGAALLSLGAGAHLLRGLGCEHVVLRRLGALGVTFALGYLASGVIMGFYLWVSVRFFRRHGNEAFSSLRVEGYKNFLRMRVDAAGVSVWAFGLDDTRDPEAPSPRVIDRFTVPRENSV